MNRPNSLLLAAGLTLAMVSSASAYSKLRTGPRLSKLQQEFQSLYDRQAKLAWQRDAKGFMEFNTPDYFVTTLDGDSIGRSQLEEGMARFFTSGQLVRQVGFQYTVRSVELEDGEAVVLVEQFDKRIQVRRDGKPHEVVATVIHRDRWRQTADRATVVWKRHRTEEVEQTQFTIDGKAPPPKK